MQTWHGVYRTRRLLWWTLEHGGIPWVRQQLLGLAYWLDPTAYPMSEAEYQAHRAQRLKDRPRAAQLRARHGEVVRWMESTCDDLDHHERLIAAMEQTVATFRHEKRQRSTAMRGSGRRPGPPRLLCPDADECRLKSSKDAIPRLEKRRVLSNDARKFRGH